MNGSKTILIADNDILATSLLEHTLIQAGFGVVVAYRGQDALKKMETQQPDLVVLDVTLPDLSGWEICQQIRQISTVPIIILSSQGKEADRVLGLEAGADDYLTKPCCCRELLARIKAIFRRIAFARDPQGTLIQIGNVRLDTAAYKVYKQDQALPLRQKEYDLLHTLMSRPGQVISRAELLDLVWGIDWLGDTRTLDVHIRWVREKIEESPSQPRYIQTIRGVGYRFATPGDLELH